MLYTTVHGDIRLLNMVFSNEKSELIDFDFSGKADSTLYPPGYRQSLEYESRSGQGMTSVTKSEDVESLVHTLANVVRGGFNDYLRVKKDYEVDEMIALLKSGRFKISVLPRLVELMEKHTKPTRSANRTGDGDPLSPKQA